LAEPAATDLATLVRLVAGGLPTYTSTSELIPPASGPPRPPLARDADLT